MTYVLMIICTHDILLAFPLWHVSAIVVSVNGISFIQAKAVGRARSNELCFLMLLIGFCCFFNLLLHQSFLLYTKPNPYPKVKGKWKLFWSLKDSNIKVFIMEYIMECMYFF